LKKLTSNYWYLKLKKEMMQYLVEFLKSSTDPKIKIIHEILQEQLTFWEDFDHDMSLKDLDNNIHKIEQKSLEGWI